MTGEPAQILFLTFDYERTEKGSSATGPGGLVATSRTGLSELQPGAPARYPG